MLAFYELSQHEHGLLSQTRLTAQYGYFNPAKNTNEQITNEMI